MSSFSSETLHPRARPAPLPSLCMSPSTQVAADQRAVGNRHHLFNRTVAPAWWGLVRSVGFARTICQDGQPGAPQASPPTRKATLPATDEGDHRGCARARPPRGDRALSRCRPDLRSVCAAPRHHEADAGDAEQANERDGNAGVRAGAGQLVAFSARAARRLGLLDSRLRLLSGGLRLLDSRLGLLGSRLGLIRASEARGNRTSKTPRYRTRRWLRHSSSSPRSSRAA